MSGGVERPYAVVQVVDGRDGLMLPYQASIFATHARLHETGAMPSRVDHVLMHCGDVNTHPGVVIVNFSCAAIDAVVDGKSFHRHIFYKLAAFKLVTYQKIILLDFDSYISGDLMGAFEYPPPAMVRWEEPNDGPFHPNSGVVMLAPSVGMYDAALSWLRRLPQTTAKQRRAKIFEMRSPWGTFHNRSRAVDPDPGAVLAVDSDEEYFWMFWNVLERKRFGPLQELRNSTSDRPLPQPSPWFAYRAVLRCSY